MTEKASYYKYWGKARKDGEAGEPYHLLPYHCLDVAAVADVWWTSCSSLRSIFAGSNEEQERITKRWLLFFVALHDYGKLDMRFQLKAPKAVAALYPEFEPELVDIDGTAKRNYWHGPYGFALFYYDFLPSLFDGEDGHKRWCSFQPWLAAVTGHHGVVPKSLGAKYEVELDDRTQADPTIIDHDRMARMEWVAALESLFLTPAGLSIHDEPPSCNPLLAGFCAVADWLGSNSESDAFEFMSDYLPLERYYLQRLQIAQSSITQSGLIGKKRAYQGVAALLPKEGHPVPRQLQLLVNQFLVGQGLTLIEAPTGSGKTETALAYAWRMLDAGLADSIIFALPTQATANAMLKRLEEIAPLLFEQQPNLVLAHGKAAFNSDYWRIREGFRKETEQGKEEARVQCAQWLALSRKRVFLGQIGVCTIDQVLISVLPVRHKFVRGFGIGKSILIVDEVHAYDSYMYGLLGEVLRQQRSMGGSALLLSATLPAHQREALAQTWGSSATDEQQAPYPLVTHISHEGAASRFTLQEHELPEPLSVGIELIATPVLLADDALLQRMITAAQQGAQVVFVCNLVDVAQGVARKLRAASDIPVDLFHARYRFCDRQGIEQQVLAKYGKKGERKTGSILIATQVVEQSLDIDFDWMITQLCPVDLLFQRLGRLHRHRRVRPAGFEQPHCTVLIPDDEDYGYHGLIYGNTRVLWRTAQMLLKAEGRIIFPAAYREWIEAVYREEAWGDEPQSVLQSYEEFCKERDASYYTAKQLIRSDVEEFGDTDSNVAALTRDGEMSLNVLPVIATSQGNHLLDGDKLITQIDEWYRDEIINLNLVSVPKKSWGKFLPNEENGLVILPLRMEGGRAEGEFKGVIVTYSQEYGLERECSDGAN